MRTIELASPRQDAIAAEVQRQVQERYHDIIGMIQHEFRTPMTLLLGYGEYLRDALQSDIDPDELQLSVEAILSGSERLNRLIESFLQLSELQFRQANDLKLQTVMPATLWREVQAILRTEAEAAGLEIIHEAPDEIPLALVDAELVREALIRLLDNALRYVRPESREVRLGVAYDGDWICWSIEDQGPGMDAEQLRRVLEPFERGERDLSKPQSLGLSLAIIKRIAELHDGKLHVTSQVDGGSQFVLQLPYRSPAETG